MLKYASIIVSTVLLAAVKYTNYRITKTSFISITDILVVLASFWAPGIYFILKRLLLNSRCKAEMVKLESVFELLGASGASRQ